MWCLYSYWSQGGFIGQETGYTVERSPACHKMDNGSYSHSHNNCLCLDPEKPTQTRGEYANCTQASGTSWIRAHNLLAGPFGCEASAFTVFFYWRVLCRTPRPLQDMVNFCVQVSYVCFSYRCSSYITLHFYLYSILLFHLPLLSSGVVILYTTHNGRTVKTRIEMKK